MPILTIEEAREKFLAPVTKPYYPHEIDLFILCKKDLDNVEYYEVHEEDGISLWRPKRHLNQIEEGSISAAQTRFTK